MNKIITLISLAVSLLCARKGLDDYSTRRHEDNARIIEDRTKRAYSAFKLNWHKTGAFVRLMDSMERLTAMGVENNRR